MAINNKTDIQKSLTIICSKTNFMASLQSCYSYYELADGMHGIRIPRFGAVLRKHETNRNATLVNVGWSVTTLNVYSSLFTPRYSVSVLRVADSSPTFRC
jgi:hypothetical protein